MTILLFIILAFAVHRIVRLILEDDIFETQRDAFTGWLDKGQTLAARHIGRGMIATAVVVGALAVVPWQLTGWSAAERIHIFEACVVFGLLGAVTGCRNWLSDLLSCQFCLGVWVSAGAVAVATEAASTRFVVGVGTVFAVASAQSFLHLVEFIFVRVVLILDRVIDYLNDDDDDKPAEERKTVDDDNAATFA